MKLAVAHSPETKASAESLRKKGFSLNEICDQLGIAKSTASLWLRDVIPTRQGQVRLNGRAQLGHENGQEKAKSAAQRTYRARRKKAYTSGRLSPITDLDALCVGLYWGDGSKWDRSWGFCNADRNAISTMVLWAIRAGQPESHFKASILVHPEDSITDKLIRSFWSKAGIPADNIKILRLRSKTSSGKAKGRTPYGTCTVLPIKNGATLFSYYEGQKDQILGL